MIAWPPSWTARKQVGSKIDAAARALSRSASVPRLAAHQVSAGLLPAWRAEAIAMTASMAGAMAATSVNAAKEKVAVSTDIALDVQDPRSRPARSPFARQPALIAEENVRARA